MESGPLCSAAVVGIRTAKRDTVAMAGAEVEVFRGQAGEPERGFYEASLREEGITYVVKSSGSISQHPLTVGPMAEFSIFVAAEDESRAREVIQRLQEPQEPFEQDHHPDGDTAPSGVLTIRKSTAQQRKLYRTVGLVCLGAALYLLIPYRDASIWGIFSLLWAALFLAASRSR
jgi:hypothetical protein